MDSYANNSQQISNIADSTYRTEGAIVKTAKSQSYGYDANGNLIYVNTGTKAADGKLKATNSRKLLWDEENRLLALSDNGFVSNYWYDASGERTVKESGDGQGVSVNGVLSGATTGTSNYTLYVSPYTVISNGGQMSKHIYMGSQRILSKQCDAGSMLDPTKDTTACVKNFAAKYAALTGKVKVRYDSLGVVYRGKDNAGVGFYKASTGNTTPSLYYYHSDHLGSASLITDGTGHLNQHLAYMPNGEVFVNQRVTLFDSRFKFNAKEMDEETGLYYYSQRYLDPKYVVFTSSDQLSLKHPEISSYVYCAGNPINLIDPDGRDYYRSKDGTATIWREGNDATYTQTIKGNEGSTTIEYVRVGPTFCQVLSDGTTVSWNQNQLSTLKEQPVLSQKEISPVEKWSQSDNFLAKLSYNIVNDLYVTSQGFNFNLYGIQENPLTGGRAFSNLDGTANYEPTNSLMSTIATVVSSVSGSTLGSVPKGLGYTNKLNAAQFSKTFKGSLSKISSGTRGFLNRNLNKGINQYNKQISNGMVVLKAKSLAPKQRKK